MKQKSLAGRILTSSGIVAGILLLCKGMGFLEKVFHWREDLRSLARVNIALVRVINVQLTYVLFVFAYVSLFHWQGLVSTDIGRAVLVCISIFWFARAAGQVVFFNIRNRVSKFMFVMFIFGGTIYLVPSIA